MGERNGKQLELKSLQKQNKGEYTEVLLLESASAGSVVVRM